MKNIPAPYLRILLLLTVFVGLLGAARFILLSKIGIVKEPSASIYQEPSASIYQEPSVSILQRPSAVVSKKPATIKKSLTDKKSLTNKTPSTNSIVKPNTQSVPTTVEPIEIVEQPIVDNESSFLDHLAMQAELRLQSDVTYDGKYLKIGYPMGDVPAHIGVCTDVVIRSFRGLGIDLQQRVHEDMKSNFRSYPNKWQLSKPDSNIDHRRVPNLMTYFNRAGASRIITDNPLDYAPGDLVAWDLGGGLTHIGIVSSYVSEINNNPLIVHNIGAGPELNDVLFKYKIIGHYQYGDKKAFKQTIAEAILESLKNNPEGLVFN